MDIEIRKNSGGYELLKFKQFVTIKDIKHRIQKANGIPINQQILFSNGILQLDSSTIEKSNTFQLILKIEGGDEIFVKGFDGRTVSIDLPNKFNTTIREVKIGIQAKMGLSLEEIDLIYGGKELTDNTTIAEAGIQNESTLHLVRKTIGGHQIFVKILEGKVISLELPNQLNTTTDEIFDAIKSKLSMSLVGFDLVYGGEIITPGKTLLEAGLQNEATLHLVKQTEGGDHLYVRTNEGKTVVIDLTNGFNTTIKEIKQILESKINVNYETFILSYGGEVLPDEDKTLKDCGIQLDSTLILVKKVKGGI